MRAELQALADDLARDRRVTADEALQVRKAIFPDGVVSRDEAAMLLALDARVESADPEWRAAFAEAVTDYVLQHDVAGLVDETEAAWLAGQLGASETHVEALLKILERCDSAPASLSTQTRERVAKLCAGKPVSAADVERIRRCLYAGNCVVDADEARWLFAIDAESDGRANDPAWRDLFVKAQLCHLMGRQAPDQPTAEALRARQQWLEDASVEPFSGLMSIFTGGFKGYLSRVRQIDERDSLEVYYEAANANAEEDAALTAQERAWALGMSNEDGKLTANERALLAELQKLEGEAA